MQPIGKNQLSLLIMLFLTGGAPLFALGIQAKQDAWLAMTLAAAAGLLLTALYLRIYKRAPAAGLGELQVMHFGKWAGKASALLYVLWFGFEALRNVRDAGDLTTLALLPATPASIIMLLFLGVSAYTVNKGLAVFVRVVQLLMPVVVIGYSLVIVLLFMAKLPNWDRIQPVLEHGMAPVLQAAFLDLLALPFGQLVVMLAFWSYVGNKQKLGGTVVKAQLAASIFLIVMNALMLSVLGPELTALSALPLLEVVQLARLANVVERLDVFVTLLLFVGLYVKLTTLYFAAVLTLGSVFGVNNRSLIAPLGCIMYGMTWLAPDSGYLVWVSPNVLVKATPVFQVAIPLLMLLVGIRKKYQQAAKNGVVKSSQT
jgi:spore germination protein KB